ncbi:TPA: hypothetical protein ACF3H7_003624 [Providencia stuartii]
MKNSNQEASLAFFCTALIVSISLLIVNHDIESQFFIFNSIISIFATVLYIFAHYKYANIKLYIALVYIMIATISCWMLMSSNMSEQNKKVRDNAIKARKQAEYVINNCELKIVGAGGGFLSSPKNGYMCHDGIIYYISDSE